MKKIICLGLCLAFILMSVRSAYAEEGLTIRYTYINSIKASLSIGSGQATASGSVIPSGGMETSITVRLQRENSNGTWITISTWCGSNPGGKSEAGGTTTILAGYNYRVYVTGKVYDSDGYVIESVDKYSTTRWY